MSDSGSDSESQDIGDDSNTFTVEELCSIVGVSVNKYPELHEMVQQRDVSLNVEEIDLIHNVTKEVVVETSRNENVELPYILAGSTACPSPLTSEVGSPDSEGRKRSRRPNKRLWKREIHKKKRMKGEEYVGFQATATENGNKKYTQTMTKDARYVQPTCKSKMCEKSQFRHCEKFSENYRKKLFDAFWKQMDWGQKKAYVCSLIDKVATKRSYNLSSRRSETLVYWLKLGDEKKQVCRNMFMSTLGIGRNQIHSWLKPEKAKKQKNSSAPAMKIEKQSTICLKSFLNQLPKLPSHYCRKSSKKLYLEPIFNSKNQVYNLYRTQCQETNEHAMSRWKFWTCFEEMNLSLFHPKKDQCDLCSGHDVGNVAQEEYDLHIENKNRARDQKAIDKADADNSKCHVITMDVESVQVAPFLKASALYYKTKLVVHNFTVYDLKTHRTCCYWWDESEGELVASTFASCIVDYITDNYSDQLPIIIYSDGCTNQNRNAMMSNALLHYAMASNKEIVQKFLEKGHTQMECDSVHSAIERQLKNKTIYLPTDYSEICRRARRDPEPYNVKYLSHDFFTNYAEKASQRYNSIRPGNKTGDPCVTNIRLLKYDPLGLIYYKLKYDDDWKVLPREASDTIFTPKKLYCNRLQIPAKKYNDLQDLKQVIPAKHHAYYDSIPHK